MDITLDRAALRVVVVEDHPMMRAAMERSCACAGITVVGATASAAEAYDLVGSSRPDVVITDIGLPETSGVELTRGILQRDANAAVVIYTGLEDPVLLKDALTCGARAIAYKTAGPESLVAAIRAAAAGVTYIAPELQEAIVSGERSDRPRRLTDRERQVLALVSEGTDNDGIASELMLAPETVRTHIRNAMRKLGTHTRAHAVVEALRQEEIGF